MSDHFSFPRIRLTTPRHELPLYRPIKLGSQDYHAKRTSRQGNRHLGRLARRRMPRFRTSRVRITRPLPTGFRRKHRHTLVGHHPRHLAGRRPVAGSPALRAGIGPGHRVLGGRWQPVLHRSGEGGPRRLPGQQFLGVGMHVLRWTDPGGTGNAGAHCETTASLPNREAPATPEPIASRGAAQSAPPPV